MKKKRQTLLKEMEELRKQMVASAEVLGFCHPTVVHYSQQLDAVYLQTMRHQAAQK